MDGILIFSVSSILLIIFQKTQQKIEVTEQQQSKERTKHRKSWTINPKNLVSLKDIIDEMELCIQQDEGKRGIRDLIIPGELRKSVESLLQSEIKNVIIITGFPCMINYDPPTETDGPLGAISIARALVLIGKNVKIITDECNENVILLAVASSDIIKNFGYSRLTLESYPSIDNFDVSDCQRLKNVSDWADAVIAIERPGPNKVGDYLTMSGRSMKHLISPLEDIIGYRMNVPGNILTEITENIQVSSQDNFILEWTNLSSKNINSSNNNQNSTNNVYIDENKTYASNISSIGLSSSQNHENLEIKYFLSIGIGDGGNEVGMGKVYDKILNSKSIPLPDLIGCIVPTTYNIVSSVSNWGGYALACGLILCYYQSLLMASKRSNETDSMDKLLFADTNTTEINHQVNHPSVVDLELLLIQSMGTDQSESIICQTMVESGARDGVTGSNEMSVDGMPWEDSLSVIHDLKQIARMMYNI